MNLRADRTDTPTTDTLADWLTRERLPDVSYRQVLRNRRFLTLWLSQAVSQIFQNAVLFTLLVIIVNETGSSIHGSLLVFTYVLPSIAFGLIAGVIADRMSKRTILVLASSLRALAVTGFLLVGGQVWAIYGLNLLFSTASQFFIPAAAAAIPSLAPRGQLIAANGLFGLTFTGAQFIGLILIAPVVIKVGGTDAVLVTALLMFAASAFSASFLPRLGQTRSTFLSEPLREAQSDLAACWHLLRGDPFSFLALIQMVIGSTLVLVFAILIPRYMRDVLAISPEDAVVIFAPAGLGALLSLRVIAWLSHRISKLAIVTWGLLGLALSLVLFASLQGLAKLLTQTPLDPFVEGARRLGGLSILVTLAAIFSAPLGFSYSLINAPAQTVLYERAPAAMRGQLFAVQLVIANALSLLPLVLIGFLADLLGVNVVILIVAAFVGGAALFSAVQIRLAALIEERTLNNHSSMSDTIDVKIDSEGRVR